MINRFPRFLRYPLAASLLTAGLLAGAGAAASAGTVASAASTARAQSSATAASGPSKAERAAAIARNAIKQLLIGHHATDERAGHVAKVNGQTQVQSTNWSGYSDTGSGFNKVTASWTEPSGSCGLNLESLAAFWVGIDGYNSSSVEQDGTMIECYLGTKYQYTWWEMYPSNSVQTVGSTVAAGDQITSTVTRSGSSYTLSVTDSTHPANSFSTTQACSSGCANTSAEWIAEAPSGTLGVYPLTNFGTWNATGSAVSNGSASGGISSFPDDEITMADGLGLTEAQPSALNGGGSAFSVTWKSSS